MDIRLCVFPTSLQPKLIAYTNEYKLRNSLANSILILAGNNTNSDALLCYQLTIGNHVRYLDYNRGRSIESLLNYMTHRDDVIIFTD